MERGFNEKDEASVDGPYVEMTEQPLERIRFRYESDKTVCEITGAESNRGKPSYPSIRINNYTGRVIIIVSCVTKEEPYRPHPHYLVGKTPRETPCVNGIFITHHNVTESSNEYDLKHIGIRCTRKGDVPRALEKKKKTLEKINIATDFSNSYKEIDLSAVRLCFQVITIDDEGLCPRRLSPLITNIIHDTKSLSNLSISKVMPSSGPVAGGTEVILLLEKFTADTKVVFYLEENGREVWRATTKAPYVHKNVTIIFKTPPFRDLRIREPVKVNFRLENNYDKSRECCFEYLPDYTCSQYQRKTIPEILKLYSTDQAQGAGQHAESMQQVMSNRQVIPGQPTSPIQGVTHMQQVISSQQMTPTSLASPMQQGTHGQPTSPMQQMTYMQQVMPGLPTSPMQHVIPGQPTSPIQQVTYMQHASSMQQVIPGQPTSPMQGVTHNRIIMQPATNEQQMINAQWPSGSNEMPGTSYDMWKTCSCLQSCNHIMKHNGFQTSFNYNAALQGTPEPLAILAQQPTKEDFSKMDTDSSGSISVSKLLECCEEMEKVEISSRELDLYY